MKTSYIEFVRCSMKHYCISLILLLCLATGALATHLRCGQILVEQTGPGSKTVVVTIQMWTNTIHTNVLLGGEDDWLDFGDGTRVLVPETENVYRPDLGEGIAYAEVALTHTYDELGAYTVSYEEPNRNATIINFDNPLDTRLYLETRFLLFADRAFKSPVPMLTPVFTGFAGQPFAASLACTDPNGFALLYSLHPPLMGPYSPVANFRSPAALALDPYNGLLTWDGKFNGQSLAGEFLFAVKIRQFDVEDGWRKIGHMYRDVQVILADTEAPVGRVADNKAPENDIIVVPEETSVSLKVFAYPSESEEVAFTTATDLSGDHYAFVTYDSLHEDQKIVVGKLTVTADAAMTRLTPYVFAIRTAFVQGMVEQYLRDKSYAFSTRAFVPEVPLVTSTQEAPALSLAPNPFVDFIVLDGFSPGPSALQIYNAMGKLVMQIDNPASNTFYLPQLARGIYIMRAIVADGRIITTRIVKE